LPKIVIDGKTALNGEVKVNGAKNSALPILASTILCDGECKILDIPPLSDIKNMVSLLNGTGLKTNLNNENTYNCEMSDEISPFASYDMTNKLRASFLVAGPLLSKTGYAEVAYPGGCQIGARPVDLHLKGFAKLGAGINNKNGYIELKCGKLKGNKIYLDFPSVGATENIMMAACLASGSTVIENAAAEPEICDLANFLNTMGAEISGAGTDTIRINGVNSLTGGEYTIIPDRVEAGTYMLMAAATGGKIKLTNVICDHLKPIIAKLREIGANIIEKDTSITVEGKAALKPADIKTLPYPGFPTDLQAQFCALLSKAEGTSIVTETIFENRFMHIGELKRLGAKITVEGRTAVIEGTSALFGAEVKASDLRASASLIIAGLMAEGETVIDDPGHILRGYHNIVPNLRNLGAKVKILDDE
jgi:UDP-N-acetylglucosamine 1-carboxyvinyltransferase